MFIARSAVLAASLLAAAPAAAQPSHIPCEVASNQRLSEAEKKQIVAHAAEGVTLLASSDPAEVQRGREHLMTPLRCPEVSAAFRIEYWRAMESGIRAAIGSANDQSASNALLVAGTVAATGSLQAIDGAMTSGRESLRASAAVALQTTLRENTLGRVRLTGPVIEGTLSKTAQQMAKETSPAVFEAIVVALRAGAGEDQSVAVPAMRALGKGAAGAFASARKSADADPMGWAYAAERTTDTIWRTTYDAQVRTLDRQQGIDTAAACAQVIAYIRDRLADEDTPMSDAERAVLGRAIESAEAALILINSRVTTEPAGRKGLAAAFSQGGDAFAREADRWIGASGRLTKEPYGLDAAALSPR